jgi:hypothetical protein
MYVVWQIGTSKENCLKNQGQIRNAAQSSLNFGRRRETDFRPLPTMTTVTADYTSPMHSLSVNQKAHPSNESVKASFEALSQAIRATQTELNVFLTERKLEEDQANGINGTSSKRKATEDDDMENEDEVEEEE